MEPRLDCGWLLLSSVITTSDFPPVRNCHTLLIVLVAQAPLEITSLVTTYIGLYLPINQIPICPLYVLVKLLQRIDSFITFLENPFRLKENINNC